MIRLLFFFTFILTITLGSILSNYKAMTLLDHVAQSHHGEDHHHGHEHEKKEEKRDSQHDHSFESSLLTQSFTSPEIGIKLLQVFSSENLDSPTFDAVVFLPLGFQRSLFRPPIS